MDRIKAKDLKPGQGFIKVGGAFCHITISPSSAKHFGLDTSFVYGVSYTGNISVLNPDTEVIPVNVVDQLAANRKADQEWDIKIRGVRP